MRTFIAAHIPSKLLQKIDQITTYFKTQIPSAAIKWVDAQNLHLTLKFIGELPEEKLPAAKSLILETLEDYSRCSIGVGGLGMFPHTGQPRVIWLGIQDGEHLVAIHKSLDQALAGIGVKSEKREFHPHLTIGRVRRNTDPEEVKKIGKTLSQFKVDSLGTAQIQEITLFQSELTPQGPIYSPLFGFPLDQV